MVNLIIISGTLFDCLVNVYGAGVGEEGAVGPRGAAKTTVFINDVAFEVATGPFNVREAFGEDAVLIHSYGQPVLTNEWGVTLHSLQHGAFYYLVPINNFIPIYMHNILFFFYLFNYYIYIYIILTFFFKIKFLDCRFRRL